jgi:Mn-dependent DtxR family transcriptional regulator
MNQASDPVLEFLREYDIGVPIGTLDNNLQSSRPTIAKALEDLEDRGFVKRDPNYSSHYRITDRGRKYLKGNIDANNY